MHIITIDGPASSGKGTVAKIVAKKLEFNYLESGAIYRVVGLITLRNNLTVMDTGKILKLIDNLELQFINNKVVVNGEDVTPLIRGENIGMLASSVGKIAEIRSRLLEFQREFAKAPGLVTDGRDMGSIIFPSATLKVFLTASAEVRAKRRVMQLNTTDYTATYKAVLDDIIKRDKQDSERAVAPLTFDDSFKVLDNSNATIDATVAEIIELYKSSPRTTHM